MRLQTFRLNFSPGPEGLPSRILIAKWGLNKSVGGDYVVNETTVRELPANLRKVNFDTVDLDFEHNTVPGSPAYKAEKEPRARAAYGPLEVVPGEGIYLHAVDRWTPQGTEAVRGKHFQDLSPAILTNARGEITFIHSVALTRHGATEDLTLEVHSADEALRTLFALHSASLQMDPYKKILLMLLGLDETATDSAIHSAAGKFASRLDALSTAGVAIQTMSATIETIQKKLATTERDRLIGDAIRLGKVVTHSVSELPIDLLSKVLAELPDGVVPLERRTPDGIKLHSSRAVTSQGASEEEAQVRASLGISEASWAKYAK